MFRCSSDPQLLKFCGRPDQLTPLAWVKNVFGYGKPFDRHDWTILRSDNTQVRYVIDYYFDEEKSKEDEVPELHSASSVKSISMYARPAVDSIESLIDRIKFPVLSAVKEQKEANLLAARSKLIDKNNHRTSDDPAAAPLSVEEVGQTFAKVKSSCQKALQNVKTCTDEVTCTAAATALQLCMGNIICKPEATKFTKALDAGDDKQIETAFEAMNKSLESFQERSAAAMQEQAAREAAAKN